MAVVAEKNVQEEQAKKTFMSRLRRHKQQSTGVYTMKDREQHQETRTPSPATKKPMSKSVTRDGVPVISSTAGEDQKFKPSQVRPNKSVVKNGKNYARKSVILESAPAARDSAFSGPPRYDWIDIETAAAIKVQSVFRRNKVMSEMEAEGMETTAMRNRNRRRKACQSNNASEDAPGLFQCCGVGLIFGDATEEDEKARRDFEKSQYEEKKRQRAEHEARLRTYRPHKNELNLHESVEVVE